MVLISSLAVSAVGILPVQAEQGESTTTSIVATKNSNVQQLFTQMQQAVMKQDYELTIIKTDGNQLNETFKYRHANADDHSYAQLLYLEGPAREIIQKDNVISYFQLTSNAFSLPGKRIVEAFPDVIYHDLTTLRQYYDLFLIGKARTADSPCQLIRIVAKDKDRYSYILWLDERNHFPLRIDMIDMKNNLLENIKVADIAPLTAKMEFMDYINNTKVPSLLADNTLEADKTSYWRLDWLPAGFKEVRSSKVDFQANQINSQTYSDGVFYFSIYIDETPNKYKDEMLNLNNRVILTTMIDNHNVVVIGNLPASTIQKIAKYIVINHRK